jgi:hypothetical protein
MMQVAVNHPAPPIAPVSLIARIEEALDRAEHAAAIWAAVEELRAKGWRYDA